MATTPPPKTSVEPSDIPQMFAMAGALGVPASKLWLSSSDRSSAIIRSGEHRYEFQITASSSDVSLNGKIWLIRKPSTTGPDFVTVRVDTWSKMLKDFQAWAVLIAPAEFIAGEQPVFNDVTLDEGVTDEEIQNISRGLKRLKAFIVAKTDVSDERLRDVETKLGFLEAAARTDTRRAYGLLVVSIIASIVIQMSISHETGRQVVEFAREVLNAATTPTEPSKPQLPVAAMPDQVEPCMAVEQ